MRNNCYKVTNHFNTHPPIHLALLSTIDAVELDAFSAIVVQDFDGVAVEYTSHFTSEVFAEGRTRDKEKKEAIYRQGSRKAKLTA